MDLLEKLKREKEVREKFEEDTLRIKYAFSKIHDLHELYDGDFVNDLEDFLKNYRKMQENETK